MLHFSIFYATLLAAGTSATQLYASHYSGTLNVLSLEGNALRLVKSISTGNKLPSWITYDRFDKVLYVTDEVFYGSLSGNLASFSIGSDSALNAAGKGPTAMGVVAAALYGGADGKSFIANAH